MRSCDFGSLPVGSEVLRQQNPKNNAGFALIHGSGLKTNLCDFVLLWSTRIQERRVVLGDASKVIWLERDYPVSDIGAALKEKSC